MSRLPRHTPTPPLLALALAASLILTALALAGCTLLKPPARDAMAAYRPALGPDFQMGSVTIDALPHYSITLRVDPATLAFTGTVDMTFPVTATQGLNELYFRLYPNLKQLDGRLQVSSVSVNDQAVNYGYGAEGTALHLVLPTVLKYGSRGHVQLGFYGQAPRHSSNYYTLFGESHDVLSLTGFYPILAARRGDGWAVDIANPQGDVGYHDAALYEVSVTRPITEVTVATGTEAGQVAADPGWVTTRYVQGPAREFTVLMSPRFQVEEADAYGTRVRSYFLPEDAEAGRSALYDAVAALQIYSDRYGPYQYRDMAVVEAPLTFRGQEFPGVNLIGVDCYGKNQQDLENRVAHEVAHQWWYNQVGSDQTMTPWQDEGLAEFSMYYYYQDRYGTAVADALRRTRWTAPVAYAKDNGQDQPIGLAVTGYKSNYETIIYAKGALFFAALRDELGPDTFQRALRDYLAQYRWRIASPAQIEAVFEKASGKDLSGLFRQWLQGTPQLGLK